MSYQVQNYSNKALTGFRHIASRTWGIGLLAIILGFYEPAVAQFPQGKALDSLGIAALEEGPIAGLSIAVAHSGKVVYERGFGVQDMVSGKPASASTIYNIASTAKILAACTLIKLVESGRMALNDSLGVLLPDVPNIEVVGNITISQLLNMTSGLSDYIKADLMRLEFAPESPLTSDFVLDHLRDKPLGFGPGTNWIYTNSGFYLAGLIVERVTGVPWREYIIEEIVRPLGLSETHICDDVIDRRSRGYELVEGRFVPSALDGELGVRGDAGLCSTVRDMALLPTALGSGTVISKTGFESMLAPTRLANDLVVDYGLGVSLGIMGGHRLWGHLGGSGSLVSTLAHYPDDEITIAVLVNTRKASLGALALEGKIAEIVLGLDPSLNDIIVNSSMAATLKGIYMGGRGQTRYRFISEDGKLIRISEGSGARLTLLRQGIAEFGRSDWPYDRYVFHLVDGKAIAYSVYYNGFFDGFYRRVNR